MTEPEQPNETDLRDVAALADGSLPERRRTEVEARIAASPALGNELERQRRALSAIHAASGEVRAPAALRDRLARAGVGESRPVSSPPARPWWARWQGIALAGAAAAAVVVGVVALPGADPTVDDAAALATLAPAEPAPLQDPEQPTLLAASFEGLSYPDWEKEFGWRAVGESSDELDGRETNTVFYENDDGARIAYTIVAGDALDPPANGERTEIDGVELDAFTADGTTAVTWLRDGHTCVLAGPGVEADTLLELAAWKGDGAVAF